MGKKPNMGQYDLPEDLVAYEILPRVPINSLMRFKLVCKKWHNLIEADPLFSTNQWSSVCLDPSSFCYQEQGRPRPQNSKWLPRDMSVISNDYHNNKVCTLPFPFDLLGSSNGILYAVTRSSPDGNYSDLYVFNPLTKRSVLLPNPKKRKATVLAYDPLISTSSYTLICPFDPTTDSGRPRMDGSRYSYLFTVFGFEVFSSVTGEWRQSKAQLTVNGGASQFDFKRRSVFVGGKVYWYDGLNDILWYDVERDVAGFIPCPNPIDDEYQFFRGKRADIGACNGEVSYVLFTREGDVDIWLLRWRLNSTNGNRRGGSSEGELIFEWVKKKKMTRDRQSVGLEGIFKRNRGMVSDKKVLSVRALPYQGGEMVFFWLYRGDQRSEVFGCNIRTRELKLIGSCAAMGTDELSYMVVPFLPYQRSLLPLPQIWIKNCVTFPF